MREARVLMDTVYGDSASTTDPFLLFRESLYEIIKQHWDRTRVRTVMGLALKAHKNGMEEGRVLDMISRWSKRHTDKPDRWYAAAFADELHPDPEDQPESIPLPNGFVFPNGDVWDAKKGERVKGDNSS